MVSAAGYRSSVLGNYAPWSSSLTTVQVLHGRSFVIYPCPFENDGEWHVMLPGLDDRVMLWLTYVR